MRSSKHFLHKVSFIFRERNITEYNFCYCSFWSGVHKEPSTNEVKMKIILHNHESTQCAHSECANKLCIARHRSGKCVSYIPLLRPKAVSAHSLITSAASAGACRFATARRRESPNRFCVTVSKTNILTCLPCIRTRMGSSFSYSCFGNWNWN